MIKINKFDSEAHAAKIKIYFLGSILPILLFAMVLIPTKPAKAQTSATTFPVEEAGIAAYVKLDSVDITDLTESLNYFYSAEKQGGTYVIGKMKIDNAAAPGSQWWDCGYPWYNYPHLYIGLDGWIVAYYLKTEEASQIMQWKNYTAGAITATTLKDAIDTMVADIGATYSSQIKYYDFEFPEANKMTVIAETVSSNSNSFSVTIPGTLYEASYALFGQSLFPGWIEMVEGTLSLQVDGTDVFNSSPVSCPRYGYYDIASYFTTGVPHFVNLYDNYGHSGAATVLIYKN